MLSKIFLHSCPPAAILISLSDIEWGLRVVVLILGGLAAVYNIRRDWKIEQCSVCQYKSKPK